MKLFVTLCVLSFLIVVGLNALGIGLGIAGETCRGQLVRASWYGAESGSRTATGLRFNGKQWLVAHKTLPFGTKLRLTYRGKSVVVPVLDRGPYIRGRTLDLSRAVAVALGTIRAKDGAPFVCMERL